MVIIKDRIYGAEKISSPAVIALLRSPAVQRLKKISQFGVPDEYYHLKNISRFEHSAGVMILLKRLGASEEEQVAGLLHDISHTAFSHVVDWVFGNEVAENSQDKIHAEFLLGSPVAGILKKFGFNPRRVAEFNFFRLLDREIPDLCADRIDYALREFPIGIAQKCLKGITRYRNRIVFKDRGLAQLFAYHFLKRQVDHWGGFEAVARYNILARALKIALEEKIINPADFMRHDQYIIDRLLKSKEAEILRLLLILRNKSLAGLPRGTERQMKKFRYVDPAILVGRKIEKLSDLDSIFKRKIGRLEAKNNKGTFLPKFN
ncbi:MAG TPA: HD domain-containing protein [Candidatus Tyrphobacter sp.]|nr:HD domain-containing protein [Candidatus Tyrphobacter sp.]